MAVLEPKLAILDETDSGLDIDALRIVSSGVNRLRGPERAMLVVTHYQRLLDHIVPDFVHVLVEGRIVRSGGKEMALELEEKGYAWLEKEPAAVGAEDPPMSAVSAEKDAYRAGFERFALSQAGGVRAGVAPRAAHRRLRALRGGGPPDAARRGLAPHASRAAHAQALRAGRSRGRSRSRRAGAPAAKPTRAGRGSCS